MRTLLLFPLLMACQDPAEDPADEPLPFGEDQTITVFDAEYVYFGDENRRQVDIPITFPDDTATYSQITGRFSLTCPNDRCDWWDRYATFGVVFDAGTDDEAFVEIDRFITPYRVGFSWEADLTDVRPLLTGEQTMRIFIDTWVGEGHENGDGWLFTAELDFVGGAPPSPRPIANLPVWGHLSWRAGLPDEPVEGQVPAQSITLPAHSAATLRSFISGHGWNNRQNCAEFCPKEHFYTVGGTEHGRQVWREDCSETETDGRQQGTWEYPRAGWCPGAQVFPWDIDVSDQTAGQDAVDVSYRLEDFEWVGDGDQPYYYMSGMIIVYE
ncbi:MAG: peptide-N-glycosidase F-related protein [Myxococcota bacterium]